MKVAFVAFAVDLVYAALGQETECGLPKYIAPELRTNIVVDGVEIPLGLTIESWISSELGIYLIKHLFQEVLGYKTNITLTALQSIEGYRALSGCVPSVGGECGLFPMHHIVYEAWTTDMGGSSELAEELKDKAALFVGSCGYSGAEGWFIFPQQLSQNYESSGFSLDYYREWNASWVDASRYFDNHTSISVGMLSQCAEEGNWINQIDHYKKWFPADTGGWYDGPDGVARGVCTDGYWWLSPACRAQPTKCIPLVTAFPGWGLGQHLHQSAAYNIPLAVGMTNNLDYYASLPYLHKTLVYWWTPDSTFVQQPPLIQIRMPAHDQAAWDREDYRTASQSANLQKLASPILPTVASQAFDLLLALTLTDMQINSLLYDVKINSRSSSEAACTWLQSNQEVWRAWVPDVTKCPIGWGMKTLAGKDTDNRSLAKGCDWCETGKFSTEYKDEHGGTHICVECPLGRFQSLLGKTTCGVCLGGTFQDTTGGSACVQCPAGSVSDEDGSPSCKDCIAGSFTPAPGMTLCVACARGKFSNSSGHTECRDCGVGTYATSTGSSSCRQCGVGTNSIDLWSTMEKLSAASSADASLWSYSVGSMSESNCGCKVGSQYTSPTKEECVRCGASQGMMCSGMGDVVIMPGFAWDGKLSVYSCRGDVGRCPGGEPGVCATGRDPKTAACFKCLSGYAPGSGGTCSQCGAQETAPAALTVLALFVVLVIMYVLMSRFKSQQRESTVIVVALCSQLATLVQQLGVIGSITIEWSEPMPSLYKVLTLFNFNMDVLRLSCLQTLSKSTASVFLLRCSVVIVCGLFLSLTHFVGLAFRRKSMRENTHLLWNALGSLMLLFFLATVNTIVSPFQCISHPNGSYTVVSYTDVLCWDNSDAQHMPMVITASVFVIVPLGFISLCLAAVLMYPAKMKRGEVMYLQTFRFLFLRFKPVAYWYSTYLLIRNLLIALTPVVAQPAGQLFCFEVLMLTSLLCSTTVLPWKLLSTNVLDIAFQSGVLLVLNIGSFFLGQDGAIDSKGFALGVCVFVIVLFAAIPLGLCYAVYGIILKRLNPYTFHFFLSHHKAGAGCMARMLKHRLADLGSKRAFLDADDLKDLTLLFGYVANNTKTLVMLCSRELFLRPWCLGEIVTANGNKLDAACVLLTGFTPLTTAFVDSIADVVDLSALAPFSINASMVQESMRWAMTRRSISMPKELTDLVANELCGMLLQSKSGEVIVGETKSPKDLRCVILVDPADGEAMSSCILLRLFLVPHFSTLPEMQPFIYVSGLDSSALDFAIVACASMCFQRELVLEGVTSTCERGAGRLAVVCDEVFRYPSDVFWAEHEPIWKRLHYDVDDLKRNISSVFVDIAVAFLAGKETEGILLMRASEVAERILRKTQVSVARTINHSKASGTCRHDTLNSATSTHLGALCSGPEVDRSLNYSRAFDVGDV